MVPAPAPVPAFAFAEGKDDDGGDGSGVPFTSFINCVALLEMESSMDAADDAIELYKQDRSVEGVFFFVDCDTLAPNLLESNGKLYSSKFILLL